jgi:glucose dehydrogenase
LSCVGVAFAGTQVDLAPITGGGIVWENRGQPEFQGYALDVDGSGNTIVAAGGVAVSNETSQWYVRALDRQTGAPKWEERFGPMTFGVAKDVAVSGNRAFVAGWTYLRVVGFTFDTRAYDLDTGSVVWSQEVRLGDGCLDEHPGFGRCVAKSIAVDDGRVFVVGHVTWTANQSDFAVFAYDATTGARLWNSVTDPTGTGAFDYAWAVKAVGGSVYVVGEIGDMSALLVRAYDAATGAIRWEKQLPGARDDTIKDTLAVDGTSVFVSGSDADGHFAVWAYDQATGTPVWSDRVDDGLAGFEPAFFSASGGTLAGGGGGGDPRMFSRIHLPRMTGDVRIA